MPRPLVSVVSATYNRSTVLRYAIETVRWQTLSDWELIVVGDACTDDTAQVVASFQDPRIRFHNLEHNVGEQSGPNNEGVRLSQGAYVAFLNHDDLWLQNHLELCVDHLRTTNADLVFSLICAVNRSGGNSLTGVTPTGRYEPYMSAPASSWVVRRECVQDVGLWRSSRDCYVSPSQEWLFRARRAGKDLRQLPRLTVVAIWSGSRPGSYTRRESEEHVEYFARLSQPRAFVEVECASLANSHAARDPLVGANLDVVVYARRALRNIVRKLVLALGIPPASLLMFLRHGRKGGFIDHLRQVRGLPVIRG